MMKFDVLLARVTCLSLLTYSLCLAQPVLVEHATRPNGPWTPLPEVSAVLSSEDMSTAQLPLPDGQVHFYRISGDSQTILWGIKPGSQGLELQFTPEDIPAPEVISVPATVVAGSEFTIIGTHLHDFGIKPKVYFGGRELSVTGASSTQLTVKVPATGWERCWNGSLTTWMVLIRHNKSAGANLTVTGIPSSPPADLSVTFNAAVQGNSMIVRGEGFSTDPAQDYFDLGGNLVQGISYEPDWRDGYGKVQVPVPDSIPTGPTGLRVRRADGDGVTWSDPVTITIHAPSDLRIDGFLDSASHFINPYGGYPAAESFDPNHMHWIITGNGFSTVSGLLHSTAGRFEVELSRDDHAITLDVFAFSDQRARVVQDWLTPEEKQFLQGIRESETFRLRPLARESVDLSVIDVPPIEVTCDRRQVLGETFPVWLPFANGAEFTVHQGALLGLFRNESGPFALTAPGLWTGEVEVTDRWLCPVDQLGTYTLYDRTSDRSATVRVVPVYSYSNTVEFGDEETRFWQDGILLGWGGLRLEIPPGALPEPVPPNRSWHRVFITEEYHQDQAFDAVVADGNRRFSIRFSPEPPYLLKPLTLTLPYDPEELVTNVQLGKWNPDAQLYLPIPSEPGPSGKRVVVIPAGDYSGTAPEQTALALHSHDTLRPLLWGYPGTALSDIMDSLGVWSNNGATSDYTDEARKIRVDVVKDSTSSHHVADDVARRVLQIAGDTHTYLVGHGWTAPSDWTVIYIRDLGNPDDYAGSTTKGVFGQPYVYINSRITGSKRDTTVAHEMAHAFQRVMTVNIVTKWIDEAVANWAAYALLGSASDVVVDINTAPEFATRPIPATFTGGYGGEEQYAASAFIIWLAQTAGSDVPAKIYQAISGNPLYWEAARQVLQTASGISSHTMVTDFALAYWGQTYPPIDELVLNIPRAQLTNWAGLTWTQFRPDFSSAALDVIVAPSFAGELTGHPLVLRSVGERVAYWVFGCQGLPGYAPKTQTQVAYLASSKPAFDLGAYGSQFAYYRIIAINPMMEGEQASITLATPHIAGLTPSSGSKQGGYEVAIRGTGFGAAAGQVRIGGFDATVTSWTDTEIKFLQINVGDTIGEWPVSVTTHEEAQLVPTTFTFENN